jgi:hypothetical protein
VKKLKAALAALLKSLGVQTALLARARRLMKAKHVAAEHAQKQRDAARNAADRLRRESQACLIYGPNEDQAKAERLRRRAARKDKKALRLDAVATKNHNKAIFWRGRAKVLSKRINGIEENVTEIRKEIAALGVTIEGNVAKGGTDFERWLAVQNASVANCLKGPPDGRRNFYDMGGAWNIDHPITPGEAYGERSDCSETLTAWAKAAGLPDPNGLNWSGGWTGSLVGEHNGWREVTFEQMVKAKRPAFFIYGSGPGHHTEGWCPVLNENGQIVNVNRTAGHGSAPVDYGVPNLFGDGDFRCFAYFGDGD